MKQLILKSPAKVNLYLNVLCRRPDGYHDIKTLLERIALFDTITIRPAQKDIRVTTNEPTLPTDTRNLAYRAAKLLFTKVGFKGGVCIDIRKNIPIAAGLGGGSSNAAAVLFGINRLFKLGLKQGDLIELGKRLGADVPFFLCDSSFAVGSGRGDEVSPICNSHINIWHIIIAFDFGVSTAEVYKSLNLKLTQKIDSVKIPLHETISLDRRDILVPSNGGVGKPRLSKLYENLMKKNDIENLALSLYNRLEEVVLSRFALVNRAKAALLRAGSYGAVMSGSGPTVFGIAKTRKEAISIGRRVEGELGRRARIFIVRNANIRGN